MTSLVEFTCDGVESSAILNRVILMERVLWVQLGLRYTATIAAFCSPVALEWASGGEVSGSVHGAGGLNYHRCVPQQRKEVYGTTKIVVSGSTTGGGVAP